MKLRICHLYGNLMNTYGDNGNLLMLQYTAKESGYEVETEIVSVGDDLDTSRYDLIFFGGGQDYEQSVVSRDLQTKKEALCAYIEAGGVILGICGGFQLLGKYYQTLKGETYPGIGAIDFYTISKKDRLIGDTEMYSDRFQETYFGYENHAGRTYLGDKVQGLGRTVQGYGNNDDDKVEGVVYKNAFGSYFHGPFLVRNPHFAQRLVNLAMNKEAQIKN